MDRQQYMARLSKIDELSAGLRSEAGRALAEQPSLEAVVGLLEEWIGAERRCRRCAAKGPRSICNAELVSVYVKYMLAASDKEPINNIIINKVHRRQTIETNNGQKI